MGHEFLFAADQIAEPSFQTDLVLRNANLSRSALHGLFWIDNVFFSSIFGNKTSFAEMLLQS